MLWCVYMWRTDWADGQLVIQRKLLSKWLDTGEKNVDENYGQSPWCNPPARSHQLIQIYRPLKQSFLKQYGILFILKHEGLSLLYEGNSSHADEKALDSACPVFPGREAAKSNIKQNPSLLLFISLLCRLFDFAIGVAYNVLSAVNNNSVNLCSISKGSAKPTNIKDMSPLSCCNCLEDMRRLQNNCKKGCV